MSTTSESEDEGSTVRDDGLNISSAFHHHRPSKKTTISEEKQSLLQEWGLNGNSDKSCQINCLLESFEIEMGLLLNRETKSLSESVCSFVNEHKDQKGSYIPTAWTFVGWRMIDRDAIFDSIESKLSKDKSLLVVRFSLYQLADIESMKKKLISELLEDERIQEKVKIKDDRKMKTIPFHLLAQYTSGQLQKRFTLVVIIDETEKVDANALSSFILLLRQAFEYLPSCLILGCCTASLQFHQMIHSKANDCLFVKQILSPSPKKMAQTVLSDLLVSQKWFSFKLGPTIVKLLEDNFTIYSFSLERFLSILKLVIMRHFQDNDLSFLSVSTETDLDQILKKVDPEKLTSLITTLPSLPEDKQKTLNAGNIGHYIKESIMNICHCHEHFLAALSCLVFLGEDLRDSLGATIAACYIKLTDAQSIGSSPYFDPFLRSLRALSLDELLLRLEKCVNNIPVKQKESKNGDDSIATFFHRKYAEFKDLETKLNNPENNKSTTNTPSTASKTTANASNIFTGIRSRSEFKSRLQENLKNSKDSFTVSSTTIFEEFRNQFIQQLKRVYNDVKSPLHMPLNEVVYLNNSASVIRLYFPPIRSKLFASLRNDEEWKSTVMSKTYSEIAISPAFVGLEEVHEKIELSTASPKKKSKKNSGSKDNEQTQGSEELVFTLINDMEYIGLIQKDKRKTGRVTKLTWE